MRRVLSLGVVVLSGVFLVGCAVSQPTVRVSPAPLVQSDPPERPSDTEPDRAALLDAGAATRAALKEGGSYTARIVHDFGTTKLFIQAAETPESRRFDFSGELPSGRTFDWGTLVMQPGRWAFRDSEHRESVSRPGETSFELPMLYICLNRSALVTVVPSFFERARYLRTEQGRALYGAPLLPADLEELKQAVEALRTKRNLDARETALLESAEDMIAHGMLYGVDLQSGLVSQLNGGKPVRFEAFHLVDALPAELFQLASEKAPPAALTRAQMSQQVMVAYLGAWKPGMALKDTETVLVDVSTGQRRRVPTTDAVTLPGVIEPNSTKVVVAVAERETSMRLVEVDLTTGAQHDIASDTSPSGLIVSPTVSPDGRRVAAIRFATGRDLSRGRLELTTLASGFTESRELPEGVHRITWLSSGDRWLVEQDVTPQVSVIGVLDAHSKLTPIVPGRHAIELPAEKQLLFEDDGTWKVCDLDGKNVRPFGTGFPKVREAALSPDGRSLIMVKVSDSGERHLVMVDVKTRSPVGEVTGAPGWFGYPAWR